MSFIKRPALLPVEEDHNRRDSTFFVDRLKTDAAMMREDLEELMERLRHTRLEVYNDLLHYPAYLEEERSSVFYILADFCYFLLLNIEPIEWDISLFDDSRKFANDYITSVQNEMQVLPTRLVLIAKVLHLVTRLKTKFSSVEDYVDALRINFRGIKDPIVSLTEIRKLVLSFKDFTPNGQPAHESLSVIADKTCDVIGNLYPETKETYQPRSLKHLSRCLIRQHQKKIRRPVHRIVDKLPLPKIVKNYLLGLED